MIVRSRCQLWMRSLKETSLFRAPPSEECVKQAEIFAYVESFGQYASETFSDDISELLREHYPHEQPSLLDDVLATFVLYHPEHGHTILHPLLSCVIDGTLTYHKDAPPFKSFIALFAARDLTEQWALACGEILRQLTHYNRPIYNSEGSPDGNGKRKLVGEPGETSEGDNGKRTATRFLTPWITDSLLAAPVETRSDYFRWCSGVLGKYAGGGDLRPPTTAVSGKSHGKHPQLLSSTPRWAVANGAAVISSVCDDEVSRCETAELTAASVPALLLPPPTTILDEHLVAGLPPLEPYARLFHRYYSIATPGATQRLLLGLLEAPASWAPDALDAAVQLVELLRAAEDFGSSFKLPENWFHLHFLRPMGTAMATKEGMAADAAAALLFRIFSQAALLFTPRGYGQGAQVVQPLYGPPIHSNGNDVMEAAAAQATEEATARGVACLMRDYGLDVEWRICALWEAAYGLLPLNSSVVHLPELVVAAPLQPPMLSWNLFRPLLRVLELLPRGSPSHTCLRRIFTAVVNAVLQRAFPAEENQRGNKNGTGADGMAELRAMVHCLFTEAFLTPALGSQLLSDALTVCLAHDSVHHSNRDKDHDKLKRNKDAQTAKSRGAVATFDSYLVAAVCALACEVQLCSFSGSSPSNKVPGAAFQAKRLMSVLEALLVVQPFDPDWKENASSSNDLVAAAIVAAHISRLLRSSRACIHALSAIGRYKGDPGLPSKVATILSLVDGNGKAVESIFQYVDKLMSCTEGSTTRSGDGTDRNKGPTLSRSVAQNIINGLPKDSLGKEAATCLNASDVTNLFCGCNGVSATVSSLLKGVLKQKQDLAVAVVPLLWQRLVAARELPETKAGTSAKQGWLQVVEALCTVAVTYPERATSAILVQAEREIQPWLSGGLEKWRLNTRIVVLLSELLRFSTDVVVLATMANACVLLYKATDGMSVDGEPCTLPQLELLEAILVAIKPLNNNKVSTKGLVVLLKKRLPAIVSCLSHASPRIRALSMSLLQDIVFNDVLSSPNHADSLEKGVNPGCWLAEVEQSLAWEAHFRRAAGLSETHLVSTAASLGCRLPA